MHLSVTLLETPHLLFSSQLHHSHQPRFLHDYVSNLQPPEAQTAGPRSALVKKMSVPRVQFSPNLKEAAPKLKIRIGPCRHICVNNFTSPKLTDSRSFLIRLPSSLLGTVSSFLRWLVRNWDLLPQVVAKRQEPGRPDGEGNSLAKPSVESACLHLALGNKACISRLEN